MKHPHPKHTKKGIGPKPAPKRGLTARKIAISRAAAYTNKTFECLGKIYNLCPRQIRRKVDYVKNLAGVDSLHELGHWLHAHGLGFASEAEKESYLKQDEELRRAA